MEDEDFFNLAFVVIGFVSLIANSSIITAIALDAKLRTITNIIILNLAVANLFFLLQIVFHFTWVETGTWPLGFFGCILDNIAYGVNMIASSVFINTLGIDMIIESKWSLPFFNVQEKYLPAIISVANWFLSFAFIVPYIAHSNVNSTDNYCDIDMDTYGVYTFLMGFVIPLSLILGLFIAYIVGMYRSSPSEEIVEGRRKAHNLAIFIISAYFFCKLPLFVLDILEDIPSYVHYVLVWNIPLRVDFACYVIYYSHVAVIPIICLFCGKGYMHSLGKVCGRRPQNVLKV